MERKEFYKQLKSFLKELVVVFPEDDDDLQIVTTSINLAIIDDDSNQIVVKFYNALLPVQQLISDRNKNIFEKINWDFSSYEHKLFTKLKTQWETFTDNNKKVIWDYIQILYLLSEQFILTFRTSV
jgi:hypothetical protein